MRIGNIQRGEADEPVQISCNFLYLCAGYYRYDKGYTPNFGGIERFAGQVVHPRGPDAAARR